MMTNQEKQDHTPGPWVVGVGVNRFIMGSRETKPRSDSEQLANMNLIAAAPDMLAALDIAWRHLNTQLFIIGPHGPQDGVDQIRLTRDVIMNAITKAKFESSDP